MQLFLESNSIAEKMEETFVSATPVSICDSTRFQDPGGYLLLNTHTENMKLCNKLRSIGYVKNHCRKCIQITTAQISEASMKINPVLLTVTFK